MKDDADVLHGVCPVGGGDTARSPTAGVASHPAVGRDLQSLGPLERAMTSSAQDVSLRMTTPLNA